MTNSNENNWWKEREDFYNSLPPSCRPQKKPRPISSRSEAELRRLAYACSVDVEKAVKEGFFNLDENGQFIRWKDEDDK